MIAVRALADARAVAHAGSAGALVDRVWARVWARVQALVRGLAHVLAGEGDERGGLLVAQLRERTPGVDVDGEAGLGLPEVADAGDGVPVEQRVADCAREVVGAQAAQEARHVEARAEDVGPSAKRRKRCLPWASTERTARTASRCGQRSAPWRGCGVRVSSGTAPASTARMRLAAWWIVSPSGTAAQGGRIDCMSRRSRLLAFGSAGALVLAGGLCAALVAGVAGEVLAAALLSVGLGGAVLLVFLEVGLSEDRERAHEDERERRRGSGPSDARRRPWLRRPPRRPE